MPAVKGSLKRVITVTAAASFMFAGLLSAQADPTDPNIIPPEVTIPYSMPPSTVPAAPSTPAAGGAVPGLSGSNPPIPNNAGAAVSQYINRHGMPMSPSGVIGGNSTPPGVPVSGMIPQSMHPGSPPPPHQMPQQPAPPAVQQKDPVAIVTTTKGPVSIRLFKEYAPNTVANFVDLANKGFYNGLRWHRVESGFCIQTGCPKGDGTGSYIDPVTNQTRHVNLEISPKLRHNAAGVVAMARFGNDLNSASSQWYITLSPQPHLDGKYAVFGGVTSGLDVVRTITKQDRILSVVIQQPQ